MGVVHLKAESFKEFIQSKELAIVDFWATWCGPCRMIAPVLDELNEKTGQKVGKVNVDEEDELIKAFQIHSIPTLLAFKGGKLVGKNEGFMPYDKLLEWVNSLK